MAIETSVGYESYTAIMSLQSRFRFSSARLADGWHRNVVISIDPAGQIVDISKEDVVTTARSVNGAAIAGMPNVHSHAFQRAMAGLAESRGREHDSFWSWRERMYALANTLTPDLLNAVAAQVFVELLKSGYTSVCEFHYLHGIADEPLIASQALIDAANAAGIAMTLLPTLYQRADFTAREPAPLQRKFFLTTDAFLRLVEQLQASVQLPQNRIGVAFHSLRAVGRDALQSVMHSSLEGAPIHIHIAEQLLEVENSKKHLGTTPIQWLLDNVAVDRRWCLVHATHASSDEMAAMAKSEAIVCLCPTTEANLGDGFFDAKAFLAAGGRFAIGSDSNVSINAAEELRWIEYQRRLERLERNVLHAHVHQSSGTFLWDHAARTGADASGRESGVLKVGARGDIVVLELNLPIYAARREDEFLDTFVFCAGNEAVRDVMVGGRWLVQERKHFAETAIASGYKRAIAKIRDSIG